ncbi:Crp/Fnr family transcriptional regulator [Tenacibaculum sp. E3R01]|uniref:Crp/Fnr family transcriptional regulator n=1 Tax=Tenacibaculum sp. E3R01 TaxID=2267227 RepID=UPI000DE91C82|nr:Crp/Fnr family transcriptional regulator [Tenacibaculum sp. E3R01]RBW59394.1 Crp/Fnr family transcriptional regulator [Tenacibaculum sp. E3R01]
MDKEKIINIINEKYAPLNDECKLKFARNSKVLTLKKGDVLVKEGQNSDKAFFIVKGSARAYYLKDGKDITDWFAFENDFICAINSFFQKIPSPHYIEVLEETLLLETSRDNIMKLSNEYHAFEKLTNKVATKTMLKLQARIVSMQFQSAEQKYQNILLAYPQITQRVPLTHIASFIGITLETLSRIRKLHSRI